MFDTGQKDFLWKHNLMENGGISLVVITRNESARLTELIRHHAELVCETVILDTGSTDDTVQLAIAAGAAVYHFKWCDDFSAARNAALEKASGDYALCIDADERIAVSDFAAMREAARIPGMCYLMPQRNYYDNPQHVAWMPVTGEYPIEEAGQAGFFVAQNTKFFDLRRGLRYEQRVHEHVLASANRHQVKVTLLPVPIHHYGYVISALHNHQRNVRYNALMEMKYQEHINDVQTIEEYATSLMQMGKVTEAIPLLEQLDALPTTNSSVTRARILLGNINAAQGKPIQAERVFGRAVKNEPESLTAWVHLLRHLANEKKFKLMGVRLAEAVVRFGEQPLLLREQARYLVETHQIHEAARVSRRVAELFPGLPEYAVLASHCEALSQKLSAENQ